MEITKALYSKIKKAIIKFECGNNPQKIDEDNLQETLLKCYRIFTNKKSETTKISDDDFIKYVCKAYKINSLRNKLYHRYKYEKCYETLFENISHFLENPTEKLDIHFINNILYTNFSEEIVDLFNKHIYEDFSISELEKLYNKKGLKYQFHKIKVFIKDNILDK